MNWRNYLRSYSLAPVSKFISYFLSFLSYVKVSSRIIPELLLSFTQVPSKLKAPTVIDSSQFFIIRYFHVLSEFQVAFRIESRNLYRANIFSPVSNQGEGLTTVYNPGTSIVQSRAIFMQPGWTLLVEPQCKPFSILCNFCATVDQR